MTRRRLAVLINTAVLLSSYPAASQRFSSSTLAVRVDALVTDDGRPVGGLTAADFELRDNGVLQKLEIVDGADVPVNVVLALDTSVSTTGSRRADLIAAGEAMLARLKPIDRAALATFSHAAVPRMPLTSDLPAVQASLRSIAPAGETAVMDGAYVALTATLGQPGRSLILVCTDGYDTWSWLQPDDVLEAARRASAVIYGVTSADSRRDAALKAITDATGGHIVQAKSSRELTAVFQKILDDFRNRYILAYTPSDVSPDGYHALDVRVKLSGASVKARAGYTGSAKGR
jgi:VWFA-related protein